jgi:cell wall-associated NlpC family hydrolase
VTISVTGSGSSSKPATTPVATAPAPAAPPTTPTAPTAPTGAAAPTYPGSMLVLGMSSASVTLVQQKLKVSPATGYYGPLTQASVETFQQANGLEVDGQVGPLTWARIFGTAVSALPGSTPTPTTSPTTPATTPTTPAASSVVRQAGLGAKALALIKLQAGKPYLWGAAGPNSFDCSGLTQYVYKQLGITLQRSADQQYRTTLHVPYSQAQVGDLIFFYDTTGYVYHVGMYAGNGMMWDAPHSTAVVRFEDVWYPNSVWVGVPGATLK